MEQDYRSARFFTLLYIVVRMSSYSIKKISFYLWSGYVTPFESDTLLWYVFSYYFQKISHIFDQFKQWTPPFVFSNGIDDWYLPKPMLPMNIGLGGVSLEETMNKEWSRKKKKEIKSIAIKDIDLRKMYFEQTSIDKTWLDDMDKIFDSYISTLRKTSIDQKVSIPRFDSWDTNPYYIEDIKYQNLVVVYVKIYDQDMRNEFEIYMKDCMINLWRWKAKSRWYGNIKEIIVSEINEQESVFFDYMEVLKKRWLYYTINNYKPCESDIQNIDFKKSHIYLHNKNTKKLDSKSIFKWTINFVWSGSVLYTKDSSALLQGWFYTQYNSYNFGYIF
jgi:hypothetical protein